MTKTFDITGLTADQMAEIIASTNNSRLQNIIAKQFMDQMTNTALARTATKAIAKAEARPASPAKAPVKRKGKTPQTNDEKKAKRAAAERKRRKRIKDEAAATIKGMQPVAPGGKPPKV